MKITFEQEPQQDDLSAVGGLLAAVTNIELEPEIGELVLTQHWLTFRNEWVIITIKDGLDYQRFRRTNSKTYVHIEYSCKECGTWAHESDYIEEERECKKCYSKHEQKDSPAAYARRRKA